jgi:surface carbohydrate biosynthesis protein
MFKIVCKIFFFIKILLQAKYKFSFPKKKPILIYDGVLNPFYKYFSKNSNILFTRGEELNIPILFLCIKELNISPINYFSKYIKYSKTKLIITAIDNYHTFFTLSELTKVKTIFVQYGRKKWGDGLLADKNILLKKNNKKYFVDYMFVFNRHVQKIYKRIIRGKIFITGSFRNNINYQKIKKINEVLFISDYKKTFEKSDISYYDKHVINFLYNSCKKNNLKFNILCKTNDNNEIRYFKKVISDNVNFVGFNNDNVFYKYKIIRKYKYIFSIWSSLAIEAFAIGARVGFIFFKPKKYFNLATGHFERLGLRGPFWTAFSNFNNKECERVFSFVTKGSEARWKYVRRKYLKDYCVFEKDNKTFFNIVNSVLAE